MSSSPPSSDGPVTSPFLDTLVTLANQRHYDDFLPSALQEVIKATGSVAGSLLLVGDRTRQFRQGPMAPQTERQISLWEASLEQRLRSSSWHVGEGGAPPVSALTVDETGDLLVNSPLLSAGTVMGSLSLVLPAGESLSLSERQVLTSCSRIIAGLDSIIEQLAVTQRSLEQLTFLHETSRALTSTLDLPRVLDNTMELATDILDAQASTLMLIDEATNELLFDIPYGEKRELLRSYRMPMSEGIAGWVATHGQPVIANEAGSDERFSRDTDVRTGFLTQSVVCVPLKIKDRTIGVLEALNKKSSAGFNEDDLRLVSTLAAQASVAIENARLYRSLREERDRIISVQEEARRALARDLHDSTLQRLAAVAMGLGHVKQLLRHQPEQAGAELDRIEEIVRAASREARVLLFELRPLILETQGLVPALESYVDQLNAEGPPWFHFDSGGYDRRLAGDVEVTAFLIVQEAVSNARKHAAAENISLRLRPEEDQLLIVVEDDGCGFDLETIGSSDEGRTHLGLVSMRERADLIRARLDVESLPGHGTTVVLALPATPPLSKGNA